jgi:hypothetical protein
MKRNAGMVLACFIVLILASCVANFQSPSNDKTVPGSVLGLSQEEGGSKKTVTFDVVGKGLEPETAVTKGEAVLMAERAAIADGYRQLVEKIHGVYVDAFMRAGYGTVNQEMIKTHTQSWLRGVEIVEIRHAEYGITEVQMQLRINFSKQGMTWWPSGIGSDLTPS